MVVFKMRDSVPSASYSSVCNVLRQWNISLIPTYRVYRLYDRVYRLYDYYCAPSNIYFQSRLLWRPTQARKRTTQKQSAKKTKEFSGYNNYYYNNYTA